MKSQKKINIALIGCGRIGERHAKHIENLANLVAVCDTSKEKANRLGKKYEAKVFYSHTDLYHANLDIDVIAICTPNGLHARHSIDGLNAGYHVLCEKPMGISVHECGEMIKAAERNNRRLFAIKQNRFNPPVVAIKKAIDEGRFGRILSIQLNCFWNRNSEYYLNSWKGSMDLDGGTLFTQFSHFIDLLYWLVGDIKEARGFSANFLHMDDIEFEDTGVISVKFQNGALGCINYTVNSYGSNMEGSLTIFGEKGTAKIGGQYLNELEYQSFDNYEIRDLPIGGKANSYGTYQGSMSNHDKVYSNLIDVLINGAEISTSAFEGLKTVELIQNIYSSIR